MRYFVCALKILSLGLAYILLLCLLSDSSLAQSTQGLGFSEAHFEPKPIKEAVGNLFCLIEGPFGALIMVVAGIGAIIAAAVGGYRASIGMLVVAVGAFILRALVSLFFGSDFPAQSCGQAGAIAQTAP